MAEKDNVAIVLSKVGIVGADVEKTVSEWWDNFEPSTKSAYPQDMWEAADIYLKTHDVESMTGIPAGPSPDAEEVLNDVAKKVTEEVMSEYKGNVAVELSKVGIVGADVEKIVKGWVANMDPSIKSAYPSEMYEAADLYLKTHDVQRMIAMSGADLSENSQQCKVMEDEFTKHDLYKIFEEKIGKDHPVYGRIETLVDYFDKSLPKEVRIRYPEDKYAAASRYLKNNDIDHFANKMFPGGCINLKVYYQEPEDCIKHFFWEKGVTDTGDILVNMFNILLNTDIPITDIYQFDYIMDYLKRNPDYTPVTGADPVTVQIVTRMKELYFKECY